MINTGEYTRQMWLVDKKIEQAGLDQSTRFFVAGGALTSVFSNKAINDLDLFFYNEGDFNAMQKSIESKEGGCPAFTTTNAISYTLNKVRVQLIKKFFGSPEQIISNFDFTICMAAYDPKIRQIWLGDSFLYDLSQRTLCYNINAVYPIASLWRTRKFMKRDFILPAVECIKLALAVNNLNIKSYHDLKEQLEGIDTLFLKDLTDAMLLKAEQGEEYNFRQAVEWMNTVLAQKLEASGDE